MPFAGFQHASSRISPAEGPTEARLFRGALSPSGWTFRGGRNRVILLVSGTGRMHGTGKGHRRLLSVKSTSISCKCLFRRRGVGGSLLVVMKARTRRRRARSFTTGRSPLAGQGRTIE